MDRSESIQELASALCEAQGELDNASKSTSGHGYKYADLGEIIDILTPVLKKHGLSHIQSPVVVDGKACLETIILHKSGEYIANTALMAHAKLHKGNEAQMMGATIAYQRRYSLKSMFGIAEVDEEKNFKANETKTERKQEDVVAEAKELLAKCKKVDELGMLWGTLAPNVQGLLKADFGNKKQEIEPKKEKA
jgi:hypothetical protein